MSMRSCFSLAVMLASTTALATSMHREPDGGGGVAANAFRDHVSVQLERRLGEEAERNARQLATMGLLPAAPAGSVLLDWPLGPVPGAGKQLYGISNFVDLDPAFPGQLLDFTCSTRTYDTAGGYNHQGVDYFSWPFPWTLMDEGTVEVRAAAPGVLIAKGDGNDDRSCSMAAPDTPNYAMVQHADGTVAWYLHMKRDSVTSLPVGSSVATGDVLGLVGSSGISTGPHLHFELRGGTGAAAEVIEPHSGACNAIPSRWQEQHPYRVPQLLQVSTHGPAPQINQCNDVPNYRNAFMQGERVYLLIAYRDQMAGLTASMRVLLPDGSVSDEWTQLGTQTYNASWWYWYFDLPADAPNGTWTFEATYEGDTLRHRFRVGSLFYDGFEG